MGGEEQRGVEAEELGAAEKLPLLLRTPPPSWHPQTRSRTGVCSFLLLFLSVHDLLCPFSFFLWGFLGAQLFILGTGLGGGQRGICNVPTSRGQRTGNPDKNVCRYSLHGLNASMIKQKKGGKAECAPALSCVSSMIAVTTEREEKSSVSKLFRKKVIIRTMVAPILHLQLPVAVITAPAPLEPTPSPDFINFSPFSVTRFYPLH